MNTKQDSRQGKARLSDAATLKKRSFSILLVLLFGLLAVCTNTVESRASADTEGTVPVYRLYYPMTRQHLYTTDENEFRVLTSECGWRNEGIGWFAPSQGLPVWRLYNPYTLDHLYTMDINEYNTLPVWGWVQEEICWYSDPDETIPVRRLFSPVLKNGSHLYTLDANEQRTLVEGGSWKAEGVCWYACAEGIGYDWTADYPEEVNWPLPGHGKTVVLDPGHQSRADTRTEANGPGSSVMKARVTGGTKGRYTGVYEYQLVLDIGLQLRDELTSRGYTVLMTRETNDVNISNQERTAFANEAGADAYIRLHADGSDSASVSGASALAPSTRNRYLGWLLSYGSQRLSRTVLDDYCAATGMANRGVSQNDTMTGINWSQVPVTILEMGYMTNASDDRRMQDPDFQARMVQGIANGLDRYFTEGESGE